MAEFRGFTSNSYVAQSFDWVFVPPRQPSLSCFRRIHHAFLHCDAASNYMQPFQPAQKCGMLNSLHAFAKFKCRLFIPFVIKPQEQYFSIFK